MSYEVETAILSAFMVEPNNCHDAITEVRSIWFEDPLNKLVCEAIQELHRENNLIDLLTIYRKLSDKVDPYAIAKISNKVTGSNNVMYHIRILQQLFTIRELNRLGVWLSGYSEDPFEGIKELKDRLSGLEITQDYRMKRVREIVEQKADQLDKRRKAEVKIVGKPSGWWKLDKYIGGLVPGEMIVCAGRPGMGKTAFAVSLAIEHCNFGGSAIMFSIEMPDEQIADRVISSETGINNLKIRNADLDDIDMRRINQMNVPDRFFINDNSRLNIDNIGSIVKAVKAKYDVSFVIIDYMQLIRSESKGKNREQEVSYISSTCKRIAKESEVCVMALAQLSRDVEKRGGSKIPQLSDLRESGAIEQDADVVLFPFRPDYYELGNSNHEVREIEDANLVIAKCRNGMTGRLELKFQPSITKYIFE